MPAYTGVVLSNISMIQLRKWFEWTYEELLGPTGFRAITEQGVALPHHMTMNLGDCKDPKLIGRTIRLEVDAWAVDERVLAVRVSDHTGVYCDNKTPHITMYVNRPGKPRHSNELTNWIRLPHRIEVFGVVREV